MGRNNPKRNKSIKRLWHDRVRENSVVRKFGPKNSLTDNILVRRAMIHNVLRIMRNADGGATVVSSTDDNAGADIPVLVVSESIPADDDSPQEESSEVAGGNVKNPVRKYIVLPSFSVQMADEDDEGAGEDKSANEAAATSDQTGDWPDAGDLMRGMTSRKISVDSLGASLDDTDERIEVNNVSYLTIPDNGGPRRPSTADLVIEKLKVEKVDGGGLSIQGVSLASNCHVTLCVFGTFFLVAGLILSYVSFSVTAPEEKEERDRILAKEPPLPNKRDPSSVTQMRKIGPSFICIGLLMLILGITFYALAKKISRDEKAHRKALSEHHLNQLARSFRINGSSPMRTIAPAPHEPYPILSVRRNSWWVDPTPVEQPFNPDAKEIAIQCPSPHGDLAGLTSPPAKSPVPSEGPQETYNDIACFPPPPPVVKMNSDPSMNSSTNQGHETSGGQASGHSQPSSAAAHGRSQSGSASIVPFIQVTGAQNPLPASNLIKLPRLSRHCSIRMDSRPTTAETR